MPADHTELMTIAHRCACGVDVPVDPLSGGVCDNCHRYVPPDDVIFDGDTRSSLDGLNECWTAAASWDETQDDTLIGQRLGHFQIVSRLGRGGMGDVYRAMDESLQRYVALKVISARKVDDNERHVERLLQEARAQARVNHPNVVHIYYVGSEQGTPFLAMELIHGPTLSDRMKSGTIPFGDVVRIAIQIVEALRQAALYDIVHGDIKPSNILLVDGCTVKLSDFGLAQRLSDSEGAGERIAGTPNYLSPEACRGETVDVRSDMYSLGVMLFEMTFGRWPYTCEEAGPLGRINAHCSAAVEFPDPWPDSLPEGWFDVLKRLLAKNPRQRFWNHDVLLDDLRALEPVELPKAGRIVRGLAWTVDLLLGAALLKFIVGLTAEGAAADFLARHPLLATVAAGTAFSVPLLIACLQSRWKTTPGKELFQIRVVDLHGLTPSRAALGARTILPFLALWHMAFQAVCDSTDLPMVGHIAGVAVLAALGLDAITIFVRRDRRGIHDLLTGTQVVLDTKGETKPAAGPNDLL
jgi:uncharacterized RDD family membrane protein YckC